MEEERRAWLLFLSSNNYYLYMLLGIYKNLLDVKTKYPIYCGVTQEVNFETRNILKTVGLNLIDLDTQIISADVIRAVKDNNSEHYFKAFTKLTLLDTQVEKMFDKIVYIDTDVEILENIDEVFDYPHMAAIEDVAPSSNKIKTPYTLGCSKFCSGMFVWDFKNNQGKGHEILLKLPELDKKITWHDQNVLNYFYQDWREKPELHIPPEYGIMNFKANTDKLPANIKIKAIHYTSRIKTDWPFRHQKILKEYNWKFGNLFFKEWVQHIADSIKYFNEKYSLRIPSLHPENIVLLTKEEEREIKADGRRGCYLYF